MDLPAADLPVQPPAVEVYQKLFAMVNSLVVATLLS